MVAPNVISVYGVQDWKKHTTLWCARTITLVDDVEVFTLTN